MHRLAINILCSFMLITAVRNYALHMLTKFLLYLATCVHAYIYVDFDECINEVDTCHEQANCTNTFGSFECTCNAGFEGDGVNCTSKCEASKWRRSFIEPVK